MVVTTSKWVRAFNTMPVMLDPAYLVMPIPSALSLTLSIHTVTTSPEVGSPTPEIVHEPDEMVPVCALMVPFTATTVAPFEPSALPGC